MKLTHDYTEWELIGDLWAGGKENAAELAEAGKWQDFCAWLEDYLASTEEPMSLTDVNDLLWFEIDYIKEALGMKDGESEEEEA